VRFTKIICVRNSWCIVRTLNALMHALNALMHALMMHYDAYVDDVSWCTRWWYIMMHALMYALMHAWMRMRCSLRGCVCDAVYVNAHAMQPTWMRMRCSLRKCACDAVYVNTHTMQFAYLLNQLNQLNYYCLIQIIIIGFK